MTAETMSAAGARKSRAWVVLFGVGILLTLNMLFLLFATPVEDEVSGASASDVQTAVVQEQLLAIGFLGFSLFMIGIAYVPYRAGEKWSWYAMWIAPLTLGLTTAVMVINGSAAIGAMYGVFAAVIALTLLLSRRPFFSEE